MHITKYIASEINSNKSKYELAELSITGWDDDDDDVEYESTSSLGIIHTSDKLFHLIHLQNIKRTEIS